MDLMLPPIPSSWRSACFRRRRGRNVYSPCCNCNWNACGCRAPCSRFASKPPAPRNWNTGKRSCFPTNRRVGIRGTWPGWSSGSAAGLARRGGASAAAARGPAGVGLPLRGDGAGPRQRGGQGEQGTQRGGKSGKEIAASLAAVGAACGDGGHVNCAGRSAAAVADFRPATSDRCIVGDRSASRPAGGAAAWWAAIIIKWRRPPAAVFGFFAVCATDGGFCMELLIEKEEGLAQRPRKKKERSHE